MTLFGLAPTNARKAGASWKPQGLCFGFAQDGSPRASTPTMRLRRASFFSLHHRGEDGTKMGSIFAPRLYPSPPKCGRRFGFAENGDSRVSCFIAPKGAYDILRISSASAVEGVRLIHSAICKDNRRILCEEHRQGNPNHNRKP